MAKRNEIKDGVWGNPWFQSLTPNGKLVWLYLLSCPARENSGIFQLSVRTIHSDLENDEVDIPRNEIQTILEKMVEDGHILYRDSYIGICDQHQHNNYLNNEKFVINIDSQLKTVPPSILQAFAPIVIPLKYHKALSAIDRLSIGYPPNIIQYTSNLIQSKPIQTNTNQYNLIQDNGNSLGSPPEPPPDYDPEAKAAELQSLAQSVENIKSKRLTRGFKTPTLTAEQIKAKFASGEYHTLPDDEYIEAERKAAELEAKNRAEGVQKVQNGIDSQIAAMDAKDPKWWKTWVNIPLTHITLLQAEFPDKDIMRYVKCIARTQLQSPKGKQVGEGYLKSALQGKWKPEGVE